MPAMPAIIALGSCLVRADEAFCIRHQCERVEVRGGDGLKGERGGVLDPLDRRALGVGVDEQHRSRLGEGAGQGRWRVEEGAGQ